MQMLFVMEILRISQGLDKIPTMPNPYNTRPEAEIRQSNRAVIGEAQDPR
jgi:hypothetical protein